LDFVSYEINLSTELPEKYNSTFLQKIFDSKKVSNISFFKNTDLKKYAAVDENNTLIYQILSLLFIFSVFLSVPFLIICFSK
jgi:hypothetical protein